MFTMKEIIDGMECFVRFTGHARDRMIDRMITFDDVIEDCNLAAEDIFSLKEGKQVNVVNLIKNRITSIAINSDGDYNTFIDVVTVMDKAQLKKTCDNIVINKEEK